MRFASVCSGIEAASVAWEPLGWSPAWLSEIDPFPNAVLAHRFPQVPNYGDFTAITDDPAHAAHGERVELLVGGTPCQAFSVAGLRGGYTDPRGRLTLEFLRLARVLQPRWLVWENVDGVRSSNGGRDFGAFLAGLGQIGYGWAYRVLDAQYVRVDGYPRAVPQRRKRVFVVGHLGGCWQRAAAVLFEPEGLHGHPAPRRRQGQDAAAAAARRPGAGEGDGAGGYDGAGGAGGRWGGVGHLPVMASGQANAEIRVDGGAPTLTCLHEAPIAVQAFHPEVADVCGTLSDGAHHGGGLNGQDAHTGRILPVTYAPMTLAFKPGQSEAAGATFITEEFAPTLQVQNNGSTAVPAVMQAMAVRRLTPRECERLMGFPDDWTLVPWKGKDAHDGGRYKALGNSIAVNCLRWVGRRIELVDKTWGVP